MTDNRSEDYRSPGHGRADAVPVSRRSTPWLQALGALIVVTSGMLLVRPQLQAAHVAMLYVLVVLAGSSRGSRTVGLVTAALAFLLFNYFFLPPYNTLAIANPLDWLVLGTFLITSVVAAELLDRQWRQARLAERRRTELDQLAGLGAETLNAARAEHSLAAIAGVIRDSLRVARCELFVRLEHDGLESIADTQASGERAGAFLANTARPDAQSKDISNQEGLLRYIIESGRAAVLQGDGTVRMMGGAREHPDALPAEIEEATAFAIPLTVRGSTVGALRLSNDTSFALSGEQHRTLNGLAYYAALGIDRLRLEQTETTAEQLRRADQLKDSLLAAVSHDLRTPLTTIKAIAHEIAVGGVDRAKVIEQEADRLAELVDGLLELSQLNAGASPVSLQLNTVDELVGAALERSASAIGLHRIETDVEQRELLVGYFDFSSSLRVLTNLLENAAKYSPAGAAIRITARQNGSGVDISVLDRGVGISEQERALIFEPFYRIPGATADVRGAGLGLSIARKLAIAQGGNLVVHAREGGGCEFTLSLRVQ